MPGDIDRRAILKTFAAVSAASLFPMVSAQAQNTAALVSDPAKVAAVSDQIGGLLLGDGHLLLALALVHPDPVALIASWQGDLLRHSAEIAAQYRAANAAIDDIPIVGEASPDTFSVEAALASAPKAAILAGCYGPGLEDTQVTGRLADAGIPTVFVDFYVDPLKNTAPSMRAIGHLLGGESQNRAEAFAAFHEDRLKTIADRLEAAGAERPSVLLQAHAGAEGWNCCWTPGRAGLGTFVEAAGGQNIGEALSNQPWVQANLEYVLSNDPDRFITTGGPYLAGRSGLVIGPGITPEIARQSLTATVASADISVLSAIQEERYNGLWHLLHATPLNVLALEALAKWLHPNLFDDLDAASTLAMINDEFLAVPLNGCLAI